MTWPRCRTEISRSSCATRPRRAPCRSFGAPRTAAPSHHQVAAGSRRLQSTLNGWSSAQNLNDDECTTASTRSGRRVGGLAVRRADDATRGTDRLARLERVAEPQARDAALRVRSGRDSRSTRGRSGGEPARLERRAGAASRLPRARSPLLPDAVFLELVEQRAVADLEQPRGVGAVAAGRVERAPDQLGLEARGARGASEKSPRRRCERGAARGARRSPAARASVMRSPSREDHGALDHVLELAHVAGPVVRDEPLERVVARRARTGLAERVAEAAPRKWSTSSGMSSRRSRSGGTRTRHDVEPVEEVLAEAARGDLAPRGRGRSRRSRARRRCRGFDSPTGRDLLLLEDAQQLHLERERAARRSRRGRACRRRPRRRGRGARGRRR